MADAKKISGLSFFFDGVCSSITKDLDPKYLTKLLDVWTEDKLPDNAKAFRNLIAQASANSGYSSDATEVLLARSDFEYKDWFFDVLASYKRKRKEMLDRKTIRLLIEEAKRDLGDRSKITVQWLNSKLQ